MKKYLYLHEHRIQTPGSGEGSEGKLIYAASEQEAREIARRLAKEGNLTIGEDDVKHCFQRGFLAAHTWLSGEIDIDR